MITSRENKFVDALNSRKTPLIICLISMSALYYPIVLPMIKDWYLDPNYSHGFVIPLIAGYFLYRGRDNLKQASVKPHNLGFVIIFLGLMLLILGHAGREYFTMRISLIIVLAGMVLYLFGIEVFKVFSLSISYLVFMVPLPDIVYNSVAFPLKLFVTKYSVFVLQSVGVDIWREGNILIFPDSALEVTDACSGIRSLISLLALSVAYAFCLRTSSVKRFLIMASAVPAAIFANGLRVIMTGIVANYWSAPTAAGFIHDFAGMAVFILALCFILLTGLALRKSGT